MNFRQPHYHVVFFPCLFRYKFLISSIHLLCLDQSGGIISIPCISRLRVASRCLFLKSSACIKIGKTKRRLHNRKTEHFKALTSNSHSSAIADHMTQTDHRIKWDHFDILATGQSDIHCKIKETLLIRDLKPAINENVGSEKLLLY